MIGEDCYVICSRFHSLQTVLRYSSHFEVSICSAQYNLLEYILIVFRLLLKWSFCLCTIPFTKMQEVHKTDSQHPKFCSRESFLVPQMGDFPQMMRRFNKRSTWPSVSAGMIYKRLSHENFNLYNLPMKTLTFPTNSHNIT